MTCKNCKHEFCWLCMGDYKKHTAETGRSLCNSFEDVVNAKRMLSDVQEDKAALDRMLRKLDHFKTRYMEHYRSIGIAEKRKKELQEQINNCIALNNKYGPREFQFLEEIAELVIRARRALTYTYPLRFYMAVTSKTAFFDFLQGELEGSLEKLNKKNEEDWQVYLEVDGFDELFLGERFTKFKTDINNLKSTLETHFSRIISVLEADLPGIEEIEGVMELDTFSGAQNWTCPTCTVINPMSASQCPTCRTKKPEIK